METRPGILPPFVLQTAKGGDFYKIKSFKDFETVTTPPTKAGGFLGNA
jgi:hypothetical protein